VSKMSKSKSQAPVKLRETFEERMAERYRKQTKPHPLAHCQRAGVHYIVQLGSIRFCIKCKEDMP